MAVDANKLASIGYNYLGISYTAMDCQAFVEKCLSECGNSTNLPGSNAWYRTMTWKGTPEECKAQFGSIPKGAFLFILEQNGKEPEKYRHDGIGNASHIGLYTGQREGAIHSSQSRGCVCESKFAGKTIKNGGWNRIGLWNHVQYDDVKVNSVLNSGTAYDSSTAERSTAAASTPASEVSSAEETPKPLVHTAVVMADSGSTVKMREKPSTKCKLYEKVPIGATVIVNMKGDTWTRISYGKRTAWYMMTKFLNFS